MIRTNEDDLTCDLAETYHILDFRELPARKVAVLAAGLPEEARIKKRIADVTYTFDQLMQAASFDRLAWLCWAQSKDGKNGVRRPQSMAKKLVESKENKKVVAFRSGKDFKAAYARIVKGRK